VTTFIATLVFAALAIPLAWLFARQQQTLISSKLADQEKERERLTASLTEAQSDRDALRTRLAETEKTLAVERASFGEREAHLNQRLSDLEQVKTAMKTEFEAAAARIFGDKAKTFTEQNQTQLGQLLDPLRQRIIEFRKSVEDAQKSDSTQHGELKAQLEQLRSLNQTIGKEAEELTSALKGNSQVRGAWGELVLERILESTGMRKGEEFLVQESLNTAASDGEKSRRLRPDVIIRLPEGRHLVIDSKVSLKDYERAVNAPDEAARATASKAHAAAVRQHIDDLSNKRYDDTGVLFTPDYVLMFVPIEPAFTLALQAAPTLYDDAFNKRVILTTASSLLICLKTVATLWRQDRQNKNAQDIAKRGGALYDKFEGFLKDLEKIGTQLNAAQTSYSDALSKLYQGKRGTIYSEIEKLRKLGAKTTKRLPPVPAAYALDDDETEDAEAVAQAEAEPTAND